MQQFYLSYFKGSWGAGTRLGDDKKFYTNGGRVLGVTAWGSNVTQARGLAYEAVKAIQFDGGAHFRRDIGGPIISV